MARRAARGLLGSSILGFHTQLHCNNFIDAVDRTSRRASTASSIAVVARAARRTLVRAYPISIEWPEPAGDRVPARRRECRARGLRGARPAAGALLGVGVDRLDYTKGIEERLLAVERLLERYPEFRGRFTFVQLAAPSRSRSTRYRELERAASSDWRSASTSASATAEYRPIVLLDAAPRAAPRCSRFYRAADVCYVSSLHDGMNLVAKEFVGARDDERGVLVLSKFTGAARELTEALIVNPYDVHGTAQALLQALTMTPQEQRQRMRQMRAQVAEFSADRWAQRILADAARVRHDEVAVAR